MKGVAFDFDGPLFDGRAAAEAALLAVDKEFPGLAKLFPFKQLPLLRPGALLRLVYNEANLSAEDQKRLEDCYRQALQSAEEKTVADPKLIILLQHLAENRVAVGVLSSRSVSSLESRVGTLGIRRYIQVLHGRDTHDHPKPHRDALDRLAQALGVSLSDLVYVGDSDLDLACAQAAEIPYFQVLWSREPQQEAVAQADAVLETLEDLEAALLTDSTRLPCLPGTVHPSADLCEAIQNGDLCFYAGSGVSIPSGIGDWAQHYGNVFKELGVHHLMDAGLDLPEFLQLLVAQPNGAKRIFERFRNSFNRPDVDPNGYHYAILRNAPLRVWTTNYDQLFESANNRCGFGYSRAVDDSDLLEHFRSPKLLVKMNGDFEAATYKEDLDWNLIFTQEQFDLSEVQRPEIWRQFEDDYRNRCIVFVGASFRDPALHRVLATIRRRIRRTRYNHYLIKKVSSKPFERVKEDLQASHLGRMAVESIFVSGYDDVTRFIAEMAVTSRSPIIGFCGSFRADETDPAGTLPDGRLTKAQVEEYGVLLGRALAQKYRITSGCSPVIGIPPVGAAFAAAPTKARFYLRERGGGNYNGTAPAIIVPARAGEANQYKAMRERFIFELDLLIAAGGNEPKAGQPAGSLQETKLAMERHIPVLILPQVGGVLATYFDEFLRDIDSFYPDRAVAAALRKLNEETAKISAANFVTYCRDTLPQAIDQMILTLMSSALPVGKREKVSTKW